MEHCNLTARILANEDVINRPLSYEMIVSIVPIRLEIVTIQYIDKKLSVIEPKVKW